MKATYILSVGTPAGIFKVSPSPSSKQSLDDHYILTFFTSAATTLTLTMLFLTCI